MSFKGNLILSHCVNSCKRIRQGWPEPLIFSVEKGREGLPWAVAHRPQGGLNPGKVAYGLSLGHICRKNREWGETRLFATGKKPVLRCSGNVLEITSEGCRVDYELKERKEREGEETLKVSKRGEISCWTRKSRSRLLKRACAIEWEQRGEVVLAHLTYHKHQVGGREVKKHLRAIVERLKYRFEGLGLIWKMEFQERGAPHLHLLLSIPGWERWDRTKTLQVSENKRMSEFQSWLARAWWQVTGRESKEHLQAGTSAEYAENIVKAGFYFAGYSQKGSKEYQQEVPEGFEDVGRFWGVIGLEEEWQEKDLSWPEFYKARRVLKGLISSRRREKKGKAKKRVQVAFAGSWVVTEGADKLMERVLKWARGEEKEDGKKGRVLQKSVLGIGKGDNLGRYN